MVTGPAQSPPHAPHRWNWRVATTIGAVALALAGLSLGLTRACDSDLSRDDRIRNFERTITVSERRIRDSQTQIAILTQTPERD